MPHAAEPEARVRRRLAPEDRKRELIELGIRVFTTMPYSEVRLSDVAADAGFSEGLIFRYFGDKRGYYRASIFTALQMGFEAADPDPSLTQKERFLQGLDGYVTVVEKFPYITPYVNQGGPASDPEVQEAAEAFFNRVIDRIIERMQVKDPDKRLRWTVRMWITFVQSSTTRWIADKQISRDELLNLQLVAFRVAAADALGIDPVPSPEGAAPPLLP